MAADLRVKTALFVAALAFGVAAPAAAQDKRLTFYGFFDVELEATDRRGGPPWTFDQHHFNVISIFHLDQHWRMFAELEWEHGAHLEGGAGAGEVVLERAVIEYTKSNAFQLKIGKFLPPFGLYNLRHDATPTFLATSLPDVYGPHANTLGESQTLIPEFGTGVQALGSVFTRNWQAEYFTYVTNGRGPQPGGQDNNGDKGIGGRFVIHSPADVARVGVSYYADRNGEAADTRQRSIGFDAAAQIAEFVLEAEALVARIERVDTAGRPNGGFRTGRGYYAQLSHPGLERLTPFVRYEFFDPDTGTPQDGERDVMAGLNFAATGAVFFKSEVHFRGFQAPTLESYRVWLSSIAVAF